MTVEALLGSPGLDAKESGLLLSGRLACRGRSGTRAGTNLTSRIVAAVCRSRADPSQYLLGCPVLALPSLGQP